MSFVLYITIAVILAIVAAFASLVGIGGGVLYTPLQVLFGIDIHEAAATSLFLIIVLSLSATIIYRRAGKIDLRLALLLETFTVVGGFAGGYLSDFIPSKPLVILLMGSLVATSITMLRYQVKDHSHFEPRHPWYIWNRQLDGERYSVNTLIAFPLSFAAGGLSGLVGIGGGVIKVPMLVLLFSVPIDIAIATSALMVGITAVGGFVGHAAAGHFSWKMGLLFAPGVFVGAHIGARTMLRMNKAALKKAFGILMFIIALGLIARLI